MKNPSELDVDDTSRCPRAERCSACDTTAVGAERVWLDVGTITTPVGVLCVTICAMCVDANRLPKLSWPEVTRRVSAHCEHLGCDLEEMGHCDRSERTTPIGALDIGPTSRRNDRSRATTHVCAGRGSRPREAPAPEVMLFRALRSCVRRDYQSGSRPAARSMSLQ